MHSSSTIIKTIDFPENTDVRMHFFLHTLKTGKASRGENTPFNIVKSTAEINNHELFFYQFSSLSSIDKNDWPKKFIKKRNLHFPVFYGSNVIFTFHDDNGVCSYLRFNRSEIIEFFTKFKKEDGFAVFHSFDDQCFIPFHKKVTFESDPVDAPSSGLACVYIERNIIRNDGTSRFMHVRSFEAQHYLHQDNVVEVSASDHECLIYVDGRLKDFSGLKISKHISINDFDVNRDTIIKVRLNDNHTQRNS
jgi:hypothetical protein